MTEAIPDSLMTASSAITADALDALGVRDFAVSSRVKPLFDGARVVGRAYPVEVIVDLAIPEQPYDGEMSALSAMGSGDVGVYAVAASSRAAAWGELFSCAAIGRGVVGALVDGCVRDRRQIQELGFPVFSVDVSPLDTMARARVSSHGQPVIFGDVNVTKGDVVVADADGVVVVPAAEVLRVATFVGSKTRLEQGARDDLIAGMSIRAVWEKYGIF